MLWNWQRVHELVKFRLDHSDTLNKGTVKLTVTEKGLLKVERTGKETIKAYYNTGKKGIKIDKTAVLSQNYKSEVLAPDGFLIEVEA